MPRLTIIEWGPLPLGESVNHVPRILCHLILLCLSKLHNGFELWRRGPDHSMDFQHRAHFPSIRFRAASSRLSTVMGKSHRGNCRARRGRSGRHQQCPRSSL